MVVVQDLVHAFGDKTVLDGINLEVAEGEILAVMGSSGGGKTRGAGAGTGGATVPNGVTWGAGGANGAGAGPGAAGEIT